MGICAIAAADIHGCVPRHAPAGRPQPWVYVSPLRCAVRASPGLLRALLLLGLVLGAEGKKKSKFLAAYPGLFKFFLFWWCIVVFIVMGTFILDSVLTRRLGPARVDWSVEHVFRGGEGREAYWAQLADPTAWSTQHPVLQTADVRMVRCELQDLPEASGKQEDSTSPTDDAPADSAATEVDEGQDPRLQLLPAPLGPLGPGLGLVLRHKDGSEPRAGGLFCTRECSEAQCPEEGAWRLVMRTVQVGAGYPFNLGTEETTVELWPPAEADGSVRCRMSGEAAVNSRFFRWWTGLQSSTEQGAVAVLEAIGNLVEAGKKQD